MANQANVNEKAHHGPSAAEMRAVGILNFVLLVAACFVFWTGVRMHLFRLDGMREAAHAVLPWHLWSGLAFIALAITHIKINCWWFKRLVHGGQKAARVSTYVLPLQFLMFWFMAITGLGIWFWHSWHAVVPAHIIVGFCLLGSLIIHVSVRYYKELISAH